MEIANREYIKQLKADTDSELDILHKFIAVKQSIAEHWFYGRNILHDGEDWIEIIFNFSACSITISNDSNNEVSFSWDKENLSGELLAHETLDLHNLERDRIYFKGNGQIRIWAF